VSILALFMILGPVALLAGVTMMVLAMRSGVGTSPRATAMLIAGMMATAFGMLLGAFAFTVQPVETAR
jgi:uncharacterized membrane protein HdeD (DUF308 family)